MQYDITEITNGVAKILFSDGTWTFLQLSADMTEADIDDVVHQIAPPQLKTGEAPGFLQAGTSRTAAEKPAETYVDPRPQWLQNRLTAYGTIESQVEYITENGLSAWQTRVTQIKTDNPKPSE